jgi:hypothetical protein
MPVELLLRAEGDNQQTIVPLKDEAKISISNPTDSRSKL